jgi:hypothetical protein
MKSIKIIIVAVVVSIIGYTCYRWMSGNTGDPRVVKVIPADLYQGMINRIKDTFGGLTDTTLYTQQYQQIKFDIAAYGQAVAFEPNDAGLNQTKTKDLSDILYKTYVSKIIKTSQYIINTGTSDEALILNLIQEVKKEEANSLLLDVDIKNELTDVLAKLNKYNEVKRFIADIKGWEPGDFDNPGLYDPFPESNVDQRFMGPLKSYLADVSFPVNCPVLKSDLESLPIILFKKQVAYFQNKISQQLSKVSNPNLTKAQYVSSLSVILNQLTNLTNIYYPAVDNDCFSNTKNALEEFAQDIYRRDVIYSNYDPQCP